MECIEKYSRFIPHIRNSTVKNSLIEAGAVFELYVRNPEKRLEKQEPYERTKSVQKLNLPYPRPSTESSCGGLSCKTFRTTHFSLNLSEVFQKNIFASALIIVTSSLLAQMIM